MFLKQRIKEISDSTGINPEKIQTTMEQWALPLLRRGIIVRIEIKYWRARKKLSASDIGFENDNNFIQSFSENYLNFGTKLLLPKSVMNRIKAAEEQSRKNLIDHSFDTVWGRFVPCTMFSEWKERDEVCKKSFQSLRDDICENYYAYVEEIIQEYKVFCSILWKEGNINKTKWGDYQNFENDFLTGIRSNILSKENFKESFKYNSFFFFVPMPDEVEKDVQKAKDVMNQTQIQQEEHMMNIELQKDMKQYRAEQLESFIDSTVGQIKDTIINIVDDLRESVALDMDCNLTVGKNRTNLLKMVHKVRSLNFIDDKSIDEALDRIQADLDKPTYYRNNEQVWKSLRELEYAAKEKIVSIEDKQIESLEI